MRKVVLITGASGGIGSAIAEEFAAAGCAVVLHYHKNKTGAEALAAELQEKYRVDTLCLQADLSVQAEVNVLFDRVKREFGPVDVLCNNAGIAGQKLFIDLTETDWRKMFSVDVDAVFYCTRAALLQMLPGQDGCIINISSMWGQTGGSMEVAYSAAKAAVIGMTRALAKEMGPSGIRINCVAPGMIDTPMNASFDAETIEAIREETPLMRIGMPKDVAKTCVFLAGEGGSFYTGQVFAPNGGLVI